MLLSCSAAGPLFAADEGHIEIVYELPAYGVDCNQFYYVRLPVECLLCQSQSASHFSNWLLLKQGTMSSGASNTQCGSLPYNNCFLKSSWKLSVLLHTVVYCYEAV